MLVNLNTPVHIHVQECDRSKNKSEATYQERWLVRGEVASSKACLSTVGNPMHQLIYHNLEHSRTADATRFKVLSNMLGFL